MSVTRLISRNVTTVQGERTSMRLEPELWHALRDACLRENVTLAQWIEQAAQAHPEGGRTSAVRTFVLDYYRASATDDGHFAAGHGARLSGAAGAQANGTAAAPLNQLPHPITRGFANTDCV